MHRTEIGVEAATDATRTLLGLPVAPTASSPYGRDGHRASAPRGSGVRVPEGLAVVGMDDIELSAYTDPPLTTVRIEKEAMGRLAAAG